MDGRQRLHFHSRDGILTAVVLTCMRSFRSALLLGVITSVVWHGSYLIFKSTGIFFSPCLPTISIVANFSILTFVNFLFDEIRIKEQNRELIKAQDLTIFSLLSLVETRDHETGEHIIRTQQYVRILAEHLSNHPKFRKFLDRKTVHFICKSAPLHDIGKVGIQDKVLKKIGEYTYEDFEEMKLHTTLGRKAIINAEESLDENMKSSFLKFAKDITYSHHEKWDGSGYPQGLKGEEIPLCARLMALADVYDALTSKRTYKPALDHETAKEIIIQGRGAHFDPDIVDAFLEKEDAFKTVSQTYKDPE